MADYAQAASLGTGIETFPAWLISIPLVLCALGWVILGFIIASL